MNKFLYIIIVILLILFIGFLLIRSDLFSESDNNEINNNVTIEDEVEEKDHKENNNEIKIISPKTKKEIDENIKVITPNEINNNFCDNIIEAWKSIEGYPYVWGGQEIKDGGFDCSGAIYHVSKLIGKPIPRTTSRKYYLTTKGEDNHWSEGNCGWLIWWTFTPDRPYGHIGMHTNQPDVWQSGSSTGPTEIIMREGGYWDGIFDASKEFYGE